MKIQIVALGSKMPDWVQQGCEEYRKRLPREFGLTVKELPLSPRSKTTSTEAVIKIESEKLLAAVAPGFTTIALDKGGSPWSTEDLAKKIEQWRMDAQALAFLIGGPDGMSKTCVSRAREVWSLSSLTLPHPLVRVILLEQLYRAWSLLNNHPYHK